MKCRLCDSAAIPFGSGKILGKYDVQYFQCKICQLIQTEQPYWLDEAYSKAISLSDVGLVQRNIDLSKKIKSIITLLYDSNGLFLDYGGGYGLLVRLMRNAGFNFFHYDPYCENIFAQGFEADDKSSYEMVVAFEVFEHLVDPLTEIAQMLERSTRILFSTLVVPANNPSPGEWWYYGFEHGQHVALYRRETLKFIANHFGLNIYTNGTNIHLLTQSRINPFLFRASISNKTSSLLNLLIHRRSLIQHDYQQALTTIEANRL